jgi:hypothetical protein
MAGKRKEKEKKERARDPLRILCGGVAAGSQAARASACWYAV